MLGLGCFGFILLGTVGIVLVAALSGGEGSARVGDTTVLRMKLSGAIPEYVRSTGFDEFFGGTPVTVRNHVFNLEKAAKDKRIKGVLLEIDRLDGTGWAKVEELRDALLEFKKSGKFVVAFSEYLSEKEYGLALAADTIIMPKDSWFEFNGLATDIGHYPGFLEKLGIEVQYFRYGKYKSTSGEQSGAKAFSEPVKEMINDTLNVAFENFLAAVRSIGTSRCRTSRPSSRRAAPRPTGPSSKSSSTGSATRTRSRRCCARRWASRKTASTATSRPTSTAT
jgi:protease-4